MTNCYQRIWTHYLILSNCIYEQIFLSGDAILLNSYGEGGTDNDVEWQLQKCYGASSARLVNKVNANIIGIRTYNVMLGNL